MGIFDDIFGTNKKGKNKKPKPWRQGTGRPSKTINVHGDGKPNQNRNGGQPRGGRNSR